MWFALATLGGALYWGIDLAQTYGLSPGDGGELRPLWQRLAVALLVVGLGAVFPAGMWLYGRLYVARIDHDPEANKLHLYTVRFVGSRRHVVDLADVGATKHHAGRLDTGEHWVSAPWRSVRLAGWRLPLILDAQGEVLDAKLMEALFSARK
jgi:hypothetical protein